MKKKKSVAVSLQESLGTPDSQMKRGKKKQKQKQKKKNKQRNISICLICMMLVLFCPF